MQTYTISNLDGFANNIRQSVAESFSETYTENLNDFITIKQVISVIKDHAHGVDENDQFIIDENSFNSIFDSIRVWLYETALAKLVAKGHVECAFNSESNEFEFWIAEKKSND